MQPVFAFGAVLESGRGARSRLWSVRIAKCHYPAGALVCETWQLANQYFVRRIVQLNRPFGDSSLNDLAWLYKQRGILVINGLGALVALIVPDDVLNRFFLLGNFVDFLASLLPIIDNFSHNSVFPEVMRLQTSLMLLCSPFLAHIWMKWPGWEKNRSEMLRRARLSYLRLLGFHLLVVLLGVSGGVYLFLARGSDFFAAPFQSSRLALAVFGPLFFSLVPAGFFVVLASACQVLRKLWSR